MNLSRHAAVLSVILAVATATLGGCNLPSPRGVWIAPKDYVLAEPGVFQESKHWLGESWEAIKVIEEGQVKGISFRYYEQWQPAVKFDFGLPPGVTDVGFKGKIIFLSFGPSAITCFSIAYRKADGIYIREVWAGWVIGKDRTSGHRQVVCLLEEEWENTDGTWVNTFCRPQYGTSPKQKVVWGVEFKKESE